MFYPSTRLLQTFHPSKWILTILDLEIKRKGEREREEPDLGNIYLAESLSLRRRRQEDIAL